MKKKKKKKTQKQKKIYTYRLTKIQHLLHEYASRDGAQLILNLKRITSYFVQV